MLSLTEISAYSFKARVEKEVHCALAKLRAARDSNDAVASELRWTRAQVKAWLEPGVPDIKGRPFEELLQELLKSCADPGKAKLKTKEGMVTAAFEYLGAESSNDLVAAFLGTSEREVRRCRAGQLPVCAETILYEISSEPDPENNSAHLCSA